MNTKTIENKINELKEYIKKVEESGAGWNTDNYIQWKGETIKISGYEWASSDSDKYQGKLEALEELRKEIKR